MPTGVRHLAVVFAFAVLGTAIQPRSQTPVDTILINGVVITVDRADSLAQAVAITAGKIVAVGSTDAIRADRRTKPRSSICAAVRSRQA